MFLTADRGPRAADVQRQLRRALVRPRRLHGDRGLHVGAAHDPARDQEVHVPDDAAASSSPGSSRPSWARSRGRWPAPASRPRLRADHRRRRSCASPASRPASARSPCSSSSNVFNDPDDLDHARHEHADRRAEDDDVPQRADLGAHLHRRRVRLPAVAFRPAAARVPGERAGGEVGRRPGRESSGRSRGCCRASSSASAARSTGTTSSPSAPATFYFDIDVHTPIAMLVVGGMTSVSGAVVGVLLPHVRQRALPPLGGRRVRGRDAAVRARPTSCSRWCCS